MRDDNLFVESRLSDEAAKKLAVRSKLALVKTPSPTSTLPGLDYDTVGKCAERMNLYPITICATYEDAESLSIEDPKARLVSFFDYEDVTKGLAIALTIVEYHISQDTPLICLVIPQQISAVTRILTVLYGSVVILDRGKETWDHFVNFSSFEAFMRNEKASDIVDDKAGSNKYDQNKGEFNNAELETAQQAATAENKSRSQQSPRTKFPNARDSSNKSNETSDSRQTRTTKVRDIKAGKTRAEREHNSVSQSIPSKVPEYSDNATEDFDGEYE